jgi:putative salt-induced outer membrane protein YdiY
MISRKHLELFVAVLLAATSGVSVRAEEAAAAAPAAEKKPQWESTVALGFTLTRGNSETLLATLTAGTRKKWEQNEVSLGADATYGESTVNDVNTVNANSAHGFVQYNRLFTERFYGYARVDAMFDEVADINYRVSLSPGVGYYFIKNKTADLCAEVGPGYIFENLGGDVHDYATLRVGEKFHYALSDRARLTQTAEYLPQLDDFNNYIINFLIGIEADLTKDKKFVLGTFLYDTYDNIPAPGRKCNDLKLVVSIGYKF